jgi:hypothetical protein
MRTWHSQVSIAKPIAVPHVAKGVNRQRVGRICRAPYWIFLLTIILLSLSLNTLVIAVYLFVPTAHAQVVEQYTPWGKYSPSGSVVEDSLVLADDVYTAHQASSKNGGWAIQGKAYEPPKGYILKLARSGEHGFGAALYENTQTGQRTVTFAGTGDSADGQTDAEIAAKIRPEGGQSIAERFLDSPFGRERLKDASYWDSQITQALAFFAEAEKIPPTYPYQTPASSSSQSLRVTGHSLGGALAEIVGAKHHLETHTFNAVGVSEDAIGKYVGTIRVSLPIANHIRRHDLVGNFGKHIGTMVTYPDCEQGGKGSVLASPSVSDAVGTGKQLLQNHSTQCFLNDLRFNDKMKGQMSTDRSLDQKRAERAGRTSPQAPGSKPPDVVDARFSTCLTVSRGERYKEPKKGKVFKGRYVRVEDYVAVTITNSCGKMVKATNICVQAGLNPGVWKVNYFKPGPTTWKVECWESSPTTGER